MNGAMVHSYKQAFARWATGAALDDAAGAGTEVVVLSSADQLPALRDAGVVAETTAVYAPTPADGVTWTYDGPVTEPYAEVVVAETFALQVVPYALGRYLPIGGPTLLRVSEAADLEAYVADADEAHDTGRFATLFAGPTTLLADEPALGGWTGHGGPAHRLWVDADGGISTGPWGEPIGRLGDSLDTLTETWQRAQGGGVPCAVALGRAVAADVRAAALIERPWIGRYVKAVSALRGLAGRGHDSVRVSGFGGHLDEDLAGGSTVPGAAAPVLCWDDAHAFLSDGAVGRTVRISHELGRVVEKLLVLGPAAAEVIGEAEVERVAQYFRSAGLELLAPADDVLSAAS